ncbi:3-hydroxyacyl-CoA dehydrogenase [Lysinibacillus odysseyi]|uniref:3-hydroxybutyryl-CoA dehydrogenase n=1 Tax=Lysinibacillus odysseyi 34hs-1 = NBRC 100172 TaxID=1220589 RepID=A0A0A3IBY8_9BACI|nr:3-hydroxyacyl-CoA dehydrogenase [Lysinibacillus odysseyi]KGR82239.1 3-hydroxybutyryl-CoA dehydrogenase [Lysinibacillus odysseyi 34hs-1 = NBRC 100172]
MNYKNVTIAGSGVLGSQIAFQTAFKGFNVTIYDIDDTAIAKAKERIAKLEDTYSDYFRDEQEAVKSAQSRISYATVLADAVKDADLVIEAVPEIKEIKQSFYTQLGKVAPEKTVFATNSSTMLPSDFVEYTGRPEKFLALHFANTIWKNNTGEVMEHPGTDPQVVQDLLAFAAAIGMVPLHIKKEQPGYIVNSLLVPFLDAAQSLWGNDVADPETVDKTWMIATGAPLGPFAIMDVVGLQTVYNIVSTKAAHHPNPDDNLYKRIADKVKTEFLDQGKTGTQTGEGFYKYPNPAYQAPDFLKP